MLLRDCFHQMRVILLLVGVFIVVLILVINRCSNVTFDLTSVLQRLSELVSIARNKVFNQFINVMLRRVRKVKPISRGVCFSSLSRPGSLSAFAIFVRNQILPICSIRL